MCIYDAYGSPIGFIYRGFDYADGVADTCWFEKNLQGDIVAVYNANGTRLASTRTMCGAFVLRPTPTAVQAQVQRRTISATAATTSTPTSDCTISRADTTTQIHVDL